MAKYFLEVGDCLLNLYFSHSDGFALIHDAKTDFTAAFSSKVHLHRLVCSVFSCDAVGFANSSKEFSEALLVGCS